MDIKQRHITRTIWQAGRLSRSQLGKRTGLTPNAVGVVVDSLLRRGILRQCPPEPGVGAGRPQVPLEIDPSTLHVVGLAISPGAVELARIGLAGRPLSKPQARTVRNPAHLIDAAAQLLADSTSKQTLGIGVSITGFVDPVDRAILFSSAQPGRGRVSLAPIFTAAGNHPVVLENDMHALAARWLLAQRGQATQQDVLLVWIADGQLGAAMLIDGRPNRGCVTAANELGHSRFLVETQKCYCGHQGCLERIVSTDYLRHATANSNGHKRTPLTLAEQIATYSSAASQQQPLQKILSYLACGIANATNFVRPHRLVLLSGFGQNPAFDSALTRQIRSQLLTELADHVQIELINDWNTASAQSAAWLAIANLLHDGWSR